MPSPSLPTIHLFVTIYFLLDLTSNFKFYSGKDRETNGNGVSIEECMAADTSEGSIGGNGGHCSERNKREPGDGCRQKRQLYELRG